MSKILKRTLLVLLAVFIIMQFIRIDKTAPAVDLSQDLIKMTNPPGEVAALLRVACYDCHSYQTQYPWYTNVAPLSWWIGHHIEEGREHLNFSVWGTYESGDQLELLHESAEEIEEGHMPIASYTWAHGAAKLSDYQRKTLQDWFNAGQIGMKLH